MTAARPERLVVDASAVVAMLADIGPAGEWATEQATYTQLATPDLMPYEASNILRRHVLAGVLDASAAALAHTDLTALPFDLYPYMLSMDGCGNCGTTSPSTMPPTSHWQSYSACPW